MVLLQEDDEGNENDEDKQDDDGDPEEVVSFFSLSLYSIPRLRFFKTTKSDCGDFTALIEDGD